MYIDGCQHTFHKLTTDILPDYLTDLRDRIKQPHKLTDFTTGKTTILKQIGMAKDFSGCYVLIDKDPIYVGISRGVIGRLKQHVTGKTHFDASLVYRMASKEHEHTMMRAEAMKDPGFMTAFAKAQTQLRSLRVAFIEITCPVELYLFEVMAALELKTHQWNSFRTH